MSSFSNVNFKAFQSKYHIQNLNNTQENVIKQIVLCEQSQVGCLFLFGLIFFSYEKHFINTKGSLPSLVKPLKICTCKGDDTDSWEDRVFLSLFVF